MTWRAAWGASTKSLRSDRLHGNTDADWRRRLEGALAERAEAEAAAPDDDDALLHAAADWAVANMGLVHQRLRAGGLVHQGLSRALAAAAADTAGD